MIQIAPTCLWLGNAGDVRNPAKLYENGIQAIIDLAYEEPIASLPRDQIYCRFPFRDDGNNSNEMFLTALKLLVDLLKTNVSTLVGCSAGKSRSPTLVSFAIAVVAQEDPHKIITGISEITSLDVSPAFWNQALTNYNKMNNLLS